MPGDELRRASGRFPESFRKLRFNSEMPAAASLIF
jgi:hypothetical protein